MKKSKKKTMKKMAITLAMLCLCLNLSSTFGQAIWIIDPPMYDAPSFLTRPPNLTVNEGDDFSLTWKVRVSGLLSQLSAFSVYINKGSGYFYYDSVSPLPLYTPITFDFTADQVSSLGGTNTWTIKCRAINDMFSSYDYVTVTIIDTTDSDGDGLSDYDELNFHGTDPNLDDTDKDGLDDYYEVQNNYDPINYAHPTWLDTDSDSISNVIEGDEDLDNDGFENFRDTESDGDTISDFDEVNGYDLEYYNGQAVIFYKTYYTNPKLKDSDGDGLNDKEEINLIRYGKMWNLYPVYNIYRYYENLDPNNPDSDGDDLKDGDEHNAVFGYKSNPGVYDTDMDGRNDKYEIEHYTNPLENDPYWEDLEENDDNLDFTNWSWEFSEFHRITSPSYFDDIGTVFHVGYSSPDDYEKLTYNFPQTLNSELKYISFDFAMREVNDLPIFYNFEFSLGTRYNFKLNNDNNLCIEKWWIPILGGSTIYYDYFEVEDQNGKKLQFYPETQMKLEFLIKTSSNAMIIKSNNHFSSIVYGLNYQMGLTNEIGEIEFSFDGYSNDFYFDNFVSTEIDVDETPLDGPNSIPHVISYIKRAPQDMLGDTGYYSVGMSTTKSSSHTFEVGGFPITGSVDIEHEYTDSSFPTVRHDDTEDFIVWAPTYGDFYRYEIKFPNSIFKRFWDNVFIPDYDHVDNGKIRYNKVGWFKDYYLISDEEFDSKMRPKCIDLSDTQINSTSYIEWTGESHIPTDCVEEQSDYESHTLSVQHTVGLNLELGWLVEGLPGSFSLTYGLEIDKEFSVSPIFKDLDSSKGAFMKVDWYISHEENYDMWIFTYDFTDDP
ncbi:hypothetical protein [Candidatus Lokiarchaeum ossiferum]|uniref:hypothetical protein n=1 Tax=Candidatus Lokiarchaeum ossiferum TaxID=2951803 RepID=UPI00352E13AA